MSKHLSSFLTSSSSLAQGKMPNCIESDSYECEYGKRAGMCLQRDAVKKGDRVLLIDDLVATGGTLSAGIQCIKMLEGVVVECACVVELKMFIDPPEVRQCEEYRSGDDN